MVLALRKYSGKIFCMSQEVETSFTPSIASLTRDCHVNFRVPLDQQITELRLPSKGVHLPQREEGYIGAYWLGDLIHNDQQPLLIVAGHECYGRLTSKRAPEWYVGSLASALAVQVEDDSFPLIDLMDYTDEFPITNSHVAIEDLHARFFERKTD